MAAASPSVESVWSELSSDLWRFVRRRVADDHVADDLLQETFVRVQQNIDGLKEADRLRGWVYQIARNVLLDHYRRPKSGTAPLDDPPALAEGADGELNRRGAAWLRQMVARLPETFREVVELSELQGLAHREIAERLGLSLSATKSRVQRGRAELRQMLLECCRFEFDRRGNIVDYERRRNGTECGCAADADAWREC